MTLVQTEPKSIKIGSTDIKRVTIRPNGTEKQIRPVWKPGPNTIAYYPLNGDILDHKGDYGISGTTYDLTAIFGTPSYVTSFDSNKVAFNATATGHETGGCGLQNINSVWNMGNGQNFTISFCVKIGTTYNNYMSFITNRQADQYNDRYRWMNSINSSNQFFFHGTAQYLVTAALTAGTWYNITCSVVSGVYTIYINGTSVKTGSYTVGNGTPGLLNIGFGYYGYYEGTYIERLNGCLSEIIIDGNGWDETKALQRAEFLGFA